MGIIIKAIHLFGSLFLWVNVKVLTIFGTNKINVLYLYKK